MSEAITDFRWKHHFLSNFHLCSIRFEGEEYRSVEHAYQAAKTLSARERASIRKLVKAGEAKNAGQHVTLREDWEAIKIDVMRELLRQKFRDPFLKFLLLETGNAKLVEGNRWHDTFWGVCNGVGQNWLGKLLMEVREELAYGPSDPAVESST